MPGDDSSDFDDHLAGIEKRVEGKFLTGENLTIAGTITNSYLRNCL